MLKADLEKKVTALEKRIENMQKEATRIGEEAMTECCEEAQPYVQELAEALDLDISVPYMLKVQVMLPRSVKKKYDVESSDNDLANLNIDFYGKKLKVVEIDELDEY